MLIKQLTQNNEAFAPQTIAEAVLIKDSESIMRLDKLLDKRKLLSNDEFTVQESEQGTIIKHNNIITKQENKKLRSIAYDSNGHITDSDEIPIVVNDVEIDNLYFDINFGVDNNHITLNWNNINGTDV